MALMKSLNSGVSGLRSFQTKMDVIGNNISNVETTGFKGSRVNFAEMFNQRVGSTGGSSSAPQVSNHIGLGVRVSSITRDFEQGGINTTSAPTDLAIEGSGFFMVQDQNQQFLTRAGNFGFNNEGYLVTQAGYNVQGFNADAAGNILAGGATENLRVDFESVSPPQVTENAYIAGNLNADASTAQVLQAQNSFTVAATGDLADGSEDLAALTQGAALVGGETISLAVTDNAGATTIYNYPYAAGNTLDQLVADINTDIAGEGSVTLVDGLLVFRSDVLGDSQFNVAVDPGSAPEFSMPGFSVTEEGSFGSKSVSSTVYDSLGRAHTLILEFTQMGVDPITNESTWDYEARFLDGEAFTGGAPAGSITFNAQGGLTSNSTINLVFDPGNGAAPVDFDVNLGDPSAGVDFTQYSGSSTAKSVSQDGYGQGQLVDYEIDGGGFINGVYDNGQNIQLGQIALANVTNEHGLEPEGGGLFRPTLTSGQVNIDTAENLSATDIKSGALEGSNVDLATEFTELMTAQRAYQSNARVITTADDLLTEVVNLKR